ncbi:MAG: Omp28-related outer membrane protein [Flavobacteriales bacterium]|nr:Omp28-related outer membrane protein [Flavobacteriales bacterium]
MKKLLLLAAVVSFTMFSCTKSTTDPNDPNGNGGNGGSSGLASTTPSKTVAVLEDFTGVRCGYCPDGHARAKVIADANPGKFIIIANHSGGYAAPAAGWANFTTTEGALVHDQANPAGYPSGTMNRMVATSINATPMNIARSNITMDRGQWSKAATAVMNITAPVNIGATATYNASNREITITYDMYYTSTETEPNFLNIAILQDGLISKQSGGTPDPNKYVQNHVLRALPLGSFGAEITSPTTAGSRVATKKYYYQVPEYYNGDDAITGGGAGKVEDMKVVLFVTRGTKDIINAIEVDIK